MNFLIFKIGLSSHHVYYIRNYHHFIEEDEDIKLLRIVNPHGRQYWKGKWSDKDNSWNEKSKDIVKFSHRLPGEFFISFDDYLKYFKNTHI